MESINDASSAVIAGEAAQSRSSSVLGGICYENEVPPFVDAELTRLYGHIYSSLPHFRICGALEEGASTYVARSGERAKVVFLFQRRGYEARVLNEGIAIGAEELQRFADYMFSTYDALDLISFHAVRPDTQGLSYPHQRFNCLEDIVLTMPPSQAAYLAGMGSSTRDYIKRYLNKVKRNCPSFCHRVYLNDEIEEEHVREIMRLNRARMVEKGKAPGIGEDDEQRIVQLMRECGMVSVVTIEDRICAGTVNYCVGNNYFLESIAHDSRYNDYRLGTLCCYLTICECIARGGNEYHFLWGKNEYKYRLLGIERQLDHLAVYRSRRHLVWHGNEALKNVAAAYKRKLQLWLQDTQDNAAVHMAVEALRRARRLRRIDFNSLS